MRTLKWVSPALIAAMVVGAGCSDEGLGPDSDLDVEDAALIAVDTDALVGDMIFAHMGLFGGFGMGADLALDGDVRDIDRTRECPAGGTVTLHGTAERNEVEPGVFELTVDAEGAWNACAHERRGLTVTIDGAFTIDAYRKHTRGDFAGLQTTTKAGSFTWARSDGKNGSCEFSVTTTRNPSERTRHVEGTVCGRVIDRTVQWPRGRG